MVANFAWLIDQYGHIPNGNRSYYLSRSQPPFFAAMVELVAATRWRRASTASTCRSSSANTSSGWTARRTLAPGSAYRRVVRLPDGSVLNRYWDDRDTPREESYREDVATARDSGQARGGGLSQSARRRRKRLGFQLALVRRRQDARDDPHDRSDPAGSEQPAASASSSRSRKPMRGSRRMPHA